MDVGTAIFLLSGTCPSSIVSFGAVPIDSQNFSVYMCLYIDPRTKVFQIVPVGFQTRLTTSRISNLFDFGAVQSSQNVSL